jgi:peptidoglycan/xylan/chitin deacetylase (PgdA/CDA1 family)
MTLLVTAGVAAVVLGLSMIARPSLLVRWLIAPILPTVIFCGHAKRQWLALTIDDGPSGEGSDRLLAVLKRHEVPATFFLIGSHLQRREGFARRAVAEGHTVGHHMLVDSRSACLDQQDFEQEFTDTEQLLRQELPEQTGLKWFRPGGGWFHRRMLGWVKAHGYRLVLGSIFPWDTLHPPLWFQQDFLHWNAHPGGIIVLHDRPDTIDATIATLDVVLPTLQRRGYVFVTLDALLRAQAESASV